MLNRFAAAAAAITLGIARALLTLALVAGPSIAQVQLISQTAPLAVGTASANIAIAGAGNMLVLFNDGPVELFWNVAPLSTLAATTSNFPLPANACFALPIADAAGLYIAAITAAGSTTLRVSRGQGSLAGAYNCPGPSFPGSTTPIEGLGSGTTAAVVGTLAGVANKTTYICGYNVSGYGSAAAPTTLTISGLLGGSQVSQVNVPATNPTTIAQQNFNPCLPASATNTAIVATLAADATGTAINVNAWGYQQ